MGLTANVTEDVSLPDGTVTVRKLSHSKLREARDVNQSRGIGFMKEIGAELVSALRDTDSKKMDDLQSMQERMYTNHDRTTLLRKGVIAWSYEPQIVDENRNDLIDDLDEPTADTLGRAIFNLSRPETPPEAGEG